MSETSKIEWTDATWNPTVGCSVLTPGCTNCYAMKMAARLEAMGSPIYAGMTQPSKAGAVWTGKVELSNWGQMIKPLSWKKPRRIFVNSMSDLFHESLPDEAIDKVFAVMALCPQHTFQVLTKRAGRMRSYIECRGDHRDGGKAFARALTSISQSYPGQGPDSLSFPLPNVWLGVSAERQQEADERIPLLLQTPAAVRFVSCEPLLGPINLAQAGLEVSLNGLDDPITANLDWVIDGGESGSHARPYNIEYSRMLERQCVAARVAYFRKQLGARPFETSPSAWPAGFPMGDGSTNLIPDGEGRYFVEGLKSIKGGDPNEWPLDLRRREFPRVA